MLSENGGSFTPDRFSSDDEGCHSPTGEALWQESVVLCWYDAKAGMGGMHRIGHEPNRAGGPVAVLWSWVFSENLWRYARCEELPLGEADRSGRHLAAGATLSFDYLDQAIWRGREGDMRFSLTCHDYFPILDPAPSNDQHFSQNLCRNHFETATRVVGVLNYRDKQIRIAGLGYRDHSWGPRDWNNALLSHRWFAGSFGPALSFQATTVHAPDGKLFRFGFVRRPEGVFCTQRIDILTFGEPDGVSHRGGLVVFDLENEPPIEIACRGIAGTTFKRDKVHPIEVMCTAEYNGLRGFCIAEASTNPRNGTGPLTLALNAPPAHGFADYRPVPPLSAKILLNTSAAEINLTQT